MTSQCVECELAKASEFLRSAVQLAITEHARAELNSIIGKLPELAKLELLALHDREDGITK